MKYIFDFDDVIFRTTKHRLEHMFPILEREGVDRDQIDEYYKKTRLEGFSLRGALQFFFPGAAELCEKLYEEIMSKGANYINSEMVNFIKSLSKEDCFLITHGGEEFQKEKMARAGVQDLFAEIIILIGSKKEAVENICERFRNETIVFVDDKPQYFEDLDFKKYPNLKTILYAGQTKALLEAAINGSLA